MKLGVRLLPAVAGAAAALLLLKGLAFFDAPATPQRTTSLDAAASRNFFAVRADGALYDPESTGSTATPAKDDGSQKKDAAPAKKDDKKAPPVPGQPVNLDAPAVSPAEKALLEKLGQRREQLEERQRELETRENLLKAADKKLESRINELKELEAKTGVSAEGGGAGGAGEAGGGPAPAPSATMKNLVTMYETMKPKDAARVFDKLEMGVLVPVVLAMNPRKMSEILAAMSPDVAGKLTVELASRRPGQQASGREAAPLPAGELQAIEPRRP